MSDKMRLDRATFAAYMDAWTRWQRIALLLGHRYDNFGDYWKHLMSLDKDQLGQELMAEMERRGDAAEEER